MGEHARRREKARLETEKICVRVCASKASPCPGTRLRTLQRSVQVRLFLAPGDPRAMRKGEIGYVEHKVTLETVALLRLGLEISSPRSTRCRAEFH